VMKNKVYKYFKDCNNVADDVMKNGILLGCHHGMSISDVNTICKIFLKFLNK
jgi:dTDP-4-amino-4,6-dideoxygalactose transaminase